mmetsp:Transcript_5449/g.16117  ORF Transcript_5449/g.16117 Transcript_5449/m.16117 type:complete len:230 (-) Transcript_5449:86-775(-)
MIASDLARVVSGPASVASLDHGALAQAAMARARAPTAYACALDVLLLDVCLLLTIIVVDVVSSVRVHLRDRARVVPGPAILSRFDPVANPQAFATASIIVTVGHGLYIFLPNASFVLPVIVSNVKRPVPAITPDLARVVSRLAAIARLDPGAFAETVTVMRASAHAATSQSLDVAGVDALLPIPILVIQVVGVVAAVGLPYARFVPPLPTLEACLYLVPLAKPAWGLRS